LEQTFVMIKPDGVMRQLLSPVIRLLETKGLKPVAMKLMQIDVQLAEEHYQEHQGKPFFPGLVAFITSGPVLAMVWEGSGAVRAVRELMGATNPQEALPGTIRGSFALDITRNVVHGSDSGESARREIALFFQPEELMTYQRPADSWLQEG